MKMFRQVRLHPWLLEHKPYIDAGIASLEVLDPTDAKHFKDQYQLKLERYLEEGGDLPEGISEDEYVYEDSSGDKKEKKEEEKKESVEKKEDKAEEVKEEVSKEDAASEEAPKEEEKEEVETTAEAPVEAPAEVAEAAPEGAGEEAVKLTEDEFLALDAEKQRELVKDKVVNEDDDSNIAKGLALYLS